ncbi:MAG: cytochrome c [Akkermansiaceae bacterium]|nr:cytochrome c [Akkermansiaceae bacterium]
MLSKSQARAFFLGGTGVFTAAFLALTYDSHRQVPKQTNEDKLTPEVIAGKVIWEDNNCMGCHTLFGEGAYYAPELTKVVERRGKGFIRSFLKDPQAMFPGERKMTNYNFTDEEIENVIAFLEWCGEVDLNGFPAKPPLGRVATQPVVTSTVPQPELFTTKTCIGCHSVSGTGGNIGPALDTVGARLTRDEIRAQIENPRPVEPGKMIMPKLPITPEELDILADYLEQLGKTK